MRASRKSRLAALLRVAALLHVGSPSGSSLASEVIFFFVLSFVQKHVVPLVTSHRAVTPTGAFLKYQKGIKLFIYLENSLKRECAETKGGKNLLFVMSQRELRLVKTLPARYWLRPLSLPGFEEGSNKASVSIGRLFLTFMQLAANRGLIHCFLEM